MYVFNWDQAFKDLISISFLIFVCTLPQTASKYAIFKKCSWAK